jgi:CDI toxin RNase A-like protein
MTPLSSIRTVLAVALMGLAACQSPPANGNEAASTPPGKMEVRAEGQIVPRDLSQDEALGGHVLRKHVGQTDDDLRERLRRERNISGASSYTDRGTAERAIGDALGRNRDRIQRWVEKPGGHANLVLDYDGDQPIGRTLNRGDSQPRLCSHAVVVLKYDPPGSYHVLTSYPECR